MLYAPTLMDEGIRRIYWQSHFPNERTAGDSFLIHFYLGIFVGRMPYAPTLSDEGIPEDQSAILFS